MKANETYTDADFDEMSWHDCYVWGVELRCGDATEGDWTADLALDIDYIADWVIEEGGGTKFRVAPATLVFHGVTDPKLDVDWGDTGFQVSIHPMSISNVSRERVLDQKIFLDRPYYSWRIELNWPRDGKIAFGAVGFTQTLRAEPVLQDGQSLSLRQRST